MKRYFLFDLDGTLCDTGAGVMGSVKYALGKLGWPEQEETFLRQFVGPPLMESFTAFCGMDEAAAQQAISIYREKYNAWGVYQSQLYPGMDRLLTRLGEVAVLGVATSKREQGARKILAMRGVEGAFSVVVGDDGSRPSKALVVTEALRMLGGPELAQVVMIGDRRYDVEGALACGVETIGAEYGYAPAGELAQAGAKWLVRSVGELQELCLSLAGERIGE